MCRPMFINKLIKIDKLSPYTMIVVSTEWGVIFLEACMQLPGLWPDLTYCIAQLSSVWVVKETFGEGVPKYTNAGQDLVLLICFTRNNWRLMIFYFSHYLHPTSFQLLNWGVRWNATGLNPQQLKHCTYLNVPRIIRWPFQVKPPQWKLYM